MTVHASQHAKAVLLQKLHQGPAILVIANAWDAASARVFELAGFRAIGTTSAGIAASYGYPDGERISRAEMLEAIKRIAGQVELPVSADIEMGYGDSVAEVVDTVRVVIAAGAVGVNLEDATGFASNALVDLNLQVEKIRAVRKAVDASGIPIVVNARTDTYWLKIGAEADRFAQTVRRLEAYRVAGADCLFAPGLIGAETIKHLVAQINAPLNILTMPGCPTVPELQQLGVARVSEGSGPMRATMAATRRIAEELLQHGTYTSFLRDTIPYAEANRMFEK